MKIVADANIPFVQECFSSVGDVTIMSGREMTASALVDADALLVRSITQVNESLLGDSAVKFVGTATIGFDHIDLDYLHANNIGFASAPGSNANSAAEYIIAALLEISQRHGITLEGKSIGVVGVGNVGSRVVKKCQALGMRVLRNDPPLQRKTGDPSYVPIKALRDCDFITFHTPLTREGVDQTFHLADEKFFSWLKEGAVLLNASRGAVVDSVALKQAITEKQLKAVVLDVWEGEPNIEVELLEMVDLGAPHIAGYSFDGKIAGLTMIYEAFCEHFGLPAKCDTSSFLPEPEVPCIELDTGQRADEALIAEAVEKVYSVKRDDANLRSIVNQEPSQRGAFFDALRKNYPIRREFQNTTVVLDDSRGSAIRKLLGIGFKVGAQQ